MVKPMTGGQALFGSSGCFFDHQSHFIIVFWQLYVYFSEKNIYWIKAY